MPESKVIKVGLVQMSCSPDPAANFEKAIAGVRSAAKRGAEVICLPELFRTQYFCQVEDHRYFQLAEHRVAVREARRGTLP